ncbi:MAG: hypothetical protein SPL12_09695 [Bacteroidales bacterium]|nr:hypothetical protein [Bacteroidales bacterium]
MKQYIKEIERWSRLCLWGSVALVIATALFVWLSPWQITQNATVGRWMLISGSVLAVLAVSMALLTIRKRIPQLRQAEGLETKLAGYAQHVRSLYLSLGAVVLALCVITVLSNQSVLLMLTMVTTMMLFPAYPNMYKVKVDLGLTDEEMRELYGEKYISDAQQ